MFLAGYLAFRRDGLVARRLEPRRLVRRRDRGFLLLWLEYRRLSGPPRFYRRRRAAERSGAEINSRRMERRILAVNQPCLRGFGVEIREVRIVGRLLCVRRLSAVRGWLFACAGRRRRRGNGMRPCRKTPRLG